ncbi:hypothetical protein [Spirulina sp. 06S082]|uniref:hypothetical protein n=1 Tax=Spirulina sp. 06S082 TaxID=3110248 RepID=UPI002B1F2B82|nr:hypothetical protein [Spirulina sp. 06S082]MEA5470758.1 hypothetical protein [Spirulina sp. 06S082]
MIDTQKWYIVKKNDGSCDLSDRQPTAGEEGSEEKKIWGPFSDRQDAIASRVGLIRAGKCKPK